MITPDRSIYELVMSIWGLTLETSGDEMYGGEMYDHMMVWGLLGSRDSGDDLG